MEKRPFWEGIERYFIIDEKIPLIATPRKENKPEELSAALKELSASLESAAPKKSIPTREAAPTKGSPEMQTESHEPGHLRTKYIVGKVAGKDLFDHRGREIIRKDMVITEEVVERADQEGKLAELIVNMMIPDFGV